ncbi:uncharacterized protein LOC131675358 [Phymastichus coffea]|uniref:uncharacterized protein LOC131675358 n=1 Tax=Phymastichus coffea TaxID=108790 RepID=UPI00273A9A5B|nr:uncharacterized protein LOC131675358 [Phymastichus coffea]XP_058810305.1 uncharacterized protein LOC131675358 [Phymastichus coffea]XP_058810310.1 uncharacterized protein LOC131675358 [Phymastichus coffea]XP_058810319.1 uncharacterized protein LOC131675358 [Phymastichus coffea]
MAQRSVYYCYQCANELCTKSLTLLPHCATGIGCFKSEIWKTGNILNFARGCITASMQNQNICNNIPDANTANNGYDCCEGHFCNDGHFANPLETNAACYNSWIYLLLSLMLLFAFGTLGTMIVTILKLNQYENQILNARREFQLKQMESESEQNEPEEICGEFESTV